MSSIPFEPIPDSTQVHVDRLLGAQVGEHQVLERVSEGRLGTIYRGKHAASGKPVTLQVLRTELTGDDEEARAANAIKHPGVAVVLGFGQLADGRRYRVMEPLAGETLDVLLQRRGRLSAHETLQILDQVAVVLQAAHAWAVIHGSLGPSSVFLAEKSVKLIDFGLGRRKVEPQHDLQALGALGFTLLTGEELRESAPPPLSELIPEPIDRFLRELLEQRHLNATSVRKELNALCVQVETPRPAPAPVPLPAPRRRSRVLPLAALACSFLAIVTAALFLSPQEIQLEPVTLAEEIEEVDDALEEEPTTATSPDPLPRQTVRSTAPRPVPTAKALYEQTTRFEALLRKQTLRFGDDVEGALFVLNKQRLRLAGNPSLEDRKDVARQLAGWKRSYLRK